MSLPQPRTHRFVPLTPSKYRSWKKSGVLSHVIPTLTAAIVAGWSMLAITLGKWSNLGYLKGTIGGISTVLYS